MLNYQVKVGLVPLRRNTNYRPPGTFLNWASAEERGARFVKYIEEHFTDEHVSFVDSKGIGINDMIFDDDSSAAIIERFRAEKVNAVFIINCNFGNEEAAADIAGALGVPVLLWAPLDDEYVEDGLRTTDSQCGIFGVSRQMQRLHIPFSHLPSCRVESEEFAAGFDSFIRTACMVKNFKGLRIGQIGLRPGPFYSVIWNEGELLEKFGVKLIPLNMGVIKQKFEAVLEEYPPEAAEYEAFLKKNYQMDDRTPPHLKQMAAYTVMLKNLFEEYHLDAISAECWSALRVMYEGFEVCAAYSILNDMDYLISCESDVHALLTMVLLKSATLGEGKPLFGEFTVRHPEDKNVELIWHCGPFPLSQKAECGICSQARLVNQRPWFRAKDGEYTIARIDQESGNYQILPLICHTADGPQTHGNYFWGRFENLQKVEDRLIDGPYIHHFVEMIGDYRKEIREFCKYVPNLKVDEHV
ncbi:MAG: hypothetical protein IJ744_12215 [Lachnospiraceae bacterium]|nr:hypothetical protein [Lachnospiraceae bacterium]